MKGTILFFHYFFKIIHESKKLPTSPSRNFIPVIAMSAVTQYEIALIIFSQSFIQKRSARSMIQDLCTSFVFPIEKSTNAWRTWFYFLTFILKKQHILAIEPILPF